MKSKRIVALFGKIGSGKTTLAKVFANKGWFTCAFADKLKDVTSDLFDIDRNILAANDQEYRYLRNTLPVTKKNISCRKLLQDFGMLVRQFDENIWISHLEKKVINSSSNRVVITDVRFLNEYNYLRKLDTYFIKVINSNSETCAHISEKDMDNFYADLIVDYSTIQHRSYRILSIVESHFANELIYPAEF